MGVYTPMGSASSHIRVGINLSQGVYTPLGGVCIKV